MTKEPKHTPGPMKTTGLNFIEAVKKSHDTGGRVMMRKNNPNGRRFFVQHAMVLDEDGNFYSDYHGFIATDWEIVPEPPKTMGFMESVEEVRKGKVVRRLLWATQKKMYDGGGVILIKCKQSQIKYEPPHYEPPHYDDIRFEDIEATDWIVVEENEVNND